MEIFKKHDLTLYSISAVLLVIIADLIIRSRYLSSFSSGDYFFYAVSFFYEILFVSISLMLFKRYAVVSSVLIILYMITVYMSYTFYSYFNTLPGINTFSFLFLSPSNSLGILSDGISVPPILITASLATTSIYFLRKIRANICHKYGKGFWICCVLFAVMTLVLNNNLRLKDNRTLPFTNAVFALRYGYTDYMKTGKIDMIGQRNFIVPGPEQYRKAEFNVLFIMNESLSPFYFMEYGSKYNTDSMMSAFMKTRPGEFFLFSNANCNSTVTAVSVPFTMAGVNPVQGKYQLQQIPLIYDYLKHDYSNISTAYITSWSYDDYPDFKSYFDSPGLDTYIYREKINAPKAVDMGADDSLITYHFGRFLSDKKKDNRFFSILHYSNTHYPYYSPADSKRFSVPDENLRNYLNSLSYLDRNIYNLFELLKKSGELERTVIFFTSDHSESLGEFIPDKGHFGKYSAFKNRIPMWVFVPENILNKESKKRLAENCSNPVSNNDIIPTIMDLYSVKVPEYMKYGSSLAGKINPERNIYIYNGRGENRTDSKNYFGILNISSFFIATENQSTMSFELYSPSDLYQKTDLWNKCSEKDRYIKTCDIINQAGKGN